MVLDLDYWTANLVNTDFDFDCYLSYWTGLQFSPNIRT